MRTSVLLAALALALPAAASAQQLGTLFHTPKEREALERLRRGEPAERATAAIERPDPVVTGFVKRSDGRSTVFLDKQPYPARDPRIQRLLDPRIVERYEPLPPPEPPQASADEGGKARAKPPEPPKPAPAPARKTGREE